MKKSVKRVLALSLALFLFVGLCPLKALAAETTTETLDGVTTTTTTTTTSTTENGQTSVVVQIQQESAGTQESTGNQIEGSLTSTDTTVTNEGGQVIATDHVLDGQEKTTEISAPDNVTVEIPLEKDQTNTETGEIKEETVSGDIQEGTDDPQFDQTTVTQETPGSVTVTTTDVTLEQQVDAENTDMDYIHSETEITADNHLFELPSGIAQIPAEGDALPEAAEGYEYVIIGYGNSSQFYAGILYTTPANENEAPAYTAPDGTKYYARRTDLGKYHRMEGAYLDGEMVADTDTTYKGIWANVAQYVLIDAKTGEPISTYCADLMTPTEDFFSYNMENIQDADYYSQEQAAMIRTVAKNGYWGVQDDATTEEAEYGSLESVKQMMRDSGAFTEEEINSLTDGVAMTATQYAIWTFSNHMSDVEFINTHYLTKDENFQSKGGLGQLGDIPESERDSVDLLFKLYDHLVNMDPTETESKTSDTIINQDNFIKDMSVTVIEKAENHANNQDTDTTNDAYVTDLTFALVVTPSTENGDDLVVSVVDANGKILASGRIAGEAAEGENVLTPDANGNYAFTGITMTEGSQNFKLTLEGIQNLKEGVYLYTSEVRTGEDGSETSSQTMVGVASGKRGVSVAMNISFDLNVEDEITVTERVWHEESHRIIPPAAPPVPEEDPGQPMMIDGDGLVEIEDEEVPLADAPKTGDVSLLFAAVSMISLGSVLMLKHKDEE